jgi:hypothetical protein
MSAVTELHALHDRMAFMTGAMGLGSVSMGFFVIHQED